MDTEILDSNRKTRQMGVRIFEDQIEDLKWLIVHKHRKRRKVASLIREGLDRYIEEEKNSA